MALHTGVAQERDDDYFGPPLNRVARLLAAGHGGQVLLSLATAELVRDTLPRGTGLRDLGEHRLKDLRRAERVFQLVAPGLPSEFPPLRVMQTLAGEAPARTGRFVGRERELESLLERLHGAQRGEGAVVMLAGEPGIGKTRLCEELTLLARGRGVTVVWGRCYEGEWAPPFGPWVEALREYAGAVPPERLREQLGRADELGVQRLVDAVQQPVFRQIGQGLEHLEVEPAGEGGRQSQHPVRLGTQPAGAPVDHLANPLRDAV